MSPREKIVIKNILEDEEQEELELMITFDAMNVEEIQLLQNQHELELLLGNVEEDDHSISSEVSTVDEEWEELLEYLEAAEEELTIEEIDTTPSTSTNLVFPSVDGEDESTEEAE